MSLKYKKEKTTQTKGTAPSKNRNTENAFSSSLVSKSSWSLVIIYESVCVYNQIDRPKKLSISYREEDLRLELIADAPKLSPASQVAIARSIISAWCLTIRFPDGTQL